VLAYFGADVGQGEHADGVDVDGVVGIGTEGGNKKQGCGSVEVLGPGDDVEEATINKLLR